MLRTGKVSRLVVERTAESWPEMIIERWHTERTMNGDEPPHIGGARSCTRGGASPASPAAIAWKASRVARDVDVPHATTPADVREEVSGVEDRLDNERLERSR
ncbi:hypothetical protein KIN20_006099 [Parelaphostrongylus tenuis]|uniref:Uncharacterized protein n=1 Tax=Parelaphostrongylus tenuis TaxID=148309 RepID=A0AAD5MJV0_PARTN|nr:hypothetical protein KIN20_006099 [Parelaphostrongylus tenuis]